MSIEDSVNLIKILKVKKIVDALLEFVKTNLASKIAADKEDKSFLSLLLSGNTDGDYDFYVQAKAIFARKSTSPRKINTSLMFNKDVKGTPHLHVREAAKIKGSFNSLGGGQGSFVTDLDDGFFNEGYRDSKKGQFEVLVTSDNPLDTILVSEVMYALLYGAHATLMREFATFSLSVKELLMQNELVPYSLYVKSITIDAEYDIDIPSIFDTELLGEIDFSLTSVPSVITVESIVVTGAGDAITIEIDNGTLQMSAAILPEDAELQTVTWSVVAGTGSAAIDSDGLLTAVTNGTVTVRAIADDMSQVYDELEITISNQT